MKVPFVDLGIQYENLKPELDQAITQCFNDEVFIGGEPVAKFEKAFAKWNGTDHCISCGNGTDAIELVLRALGIGYGDEVIVPSLTWISTATSVIQAGATPVFVDIDADSFLLDISEVKDKISSRTKAVIPVHIYGLMAPMEELLEICKPNNIEVIEDCAQAHGATLDGKKSGTFGTAATFSFYPSKNLGAYGDAGAVVTSNSELANRVRILSNVGQVTKNVHTEIGICSRMDTLQATILNVKLKYLNSWISLRNKLGNRYNQLLQGLDIDLPRWNSNSYHAFHLYVIKVDNRDLIMEKMIEKGIHCQLHYPKALVDIEPLKKFALNQDFPKVRQVTKDILSLPMYPELSYTQQDYVVDTLKELLQSKF